MCKFRGFTIKHVVTHLGRNEALKIRPIICANCVKVTLEGNASVLERCCWVASELQTENLWVRWRAMNVAARLEV